MMNGIIVGCDNRQEWLLPWWWKHYSEHNTYPVVFVDMGLTNEGRAFCCEKGICLPLTSSSFSRTKKREWELRYGPGIWEVRDAWLKKPFALQLSPFPYSLWLDLDCQVKGELAPIFYYLHLGAEIALVKDRQNLETLLPGETHYNSGVIAFRKETKILQLWADSILELEAELPGDQELLSRTIFMHKFPVSELPPIYNWFHHFGFSTSSIIHHFSGGLGKRAILKEWFSIT